MDKASKEKNKFVKKKAEKKETEYSDNSAELILGDAELESREYGADNFCAASATECTGVIQVPPENEEEYESYNEIWNFAPRTVKKDENRGK